MTLVVPKVLVGSGLQSVQKNPRFVSGHDFSRAESPRLQRALEGAE
jgi:hypothetical protein